MRISCFFLCSFLISTSSFALSFQELMDQYKDTEITISPITYEGKLVKSGPEIVCLLAGYQIAVEFEESERRIELGNHYYSMSSGWANGTAVSGFALKKNDVTRSMTDHSGTAEVEVLKTVTCRKPLSL